MSQCILRRRSNGPFDPGPDQSGLKGRFSGLDVFGNDAIIELLFKNVLKQISIDLIRPQKTPIQFLSHLKIKIQEKRFLKIKRIKSSKVTKTRTRSTKVKVKVFKMETLISFYLKKRTLEYKATSSGGKVSFLTYHMTYISGESLVFQELKWFTTW